MLLLPGSVYGQVIVEAPDDSAVRALTTPPRVTVTRIGGCTAQDQPGDLLTDAVHAWLAEWMPGVPEPDRAVTLGRRVGLIGWRPPAPRWSASRSRLDGRVRRARPTR